MNKTVTMSLSLIRCNIISSIKPKAYINISRKTECMDLTIKSWGWSVSIHIFCLCWEGVGEASTFALILRCYWIQWDCTYVDPHLEQYMIYPVNTLYCLISNTYGYPCIYGCVSQLSPDYINILIYLLLIRSLIET